LSEQFPSFFGNGYDGKTKGLIGHPKNKTKQNKTMTGRQNKKEETE
jgi:hypothetical protein